MKVIESCHGVVVLLLCLTASLSAADWPTFGRDPQRSSSVADRSVSPANASAFELKWATQVENIPLALTSLTAPVVAENVATASGSKTLVFVAGSSDSFFALDAADGKVAWNRTFDSAVIPEDESYYLCPNAVNATPTIDTKDGTIYTIARDGKLYGLDVKTGATKFGPFQFVPAFAKAWSLNLYDGVIYTATSQGCGGDRSAIYAMDVRDVMHTRTQELLLLRKHGGGGWSRGGVIINANKRLYISTGDGSFDPANGDYGSSFVSSDLKDLRILDYFAPSNFQEVNKLDLDLPSGGLVAFPYNNFELIAGGGKEALVYLLDASSLGGANHHTSLFTTSAFANEERALEQKGMWGAPAAWNDQDKGETWLYFPVWGALSKNASQFAMNNGEVPHGSILAFKVIPDKKTQQPTLQPAWISPDFNFPDAPIVVNGVLFALATGENPQQQHVQGLLHYKSVEDWKKNLLTTQERGMGTHPAVLYALDARTGKLLYQSGDSMKSWVHFSGLASADGRVFAVDHSSKVYCFGLKK